MHRYFPPAPQKTGLFKLDETNGSLANPYSLLLPGVFAHVLFFFSPFCEPKYLLALKHCWQPLYLFFYFFIFPLSGGNAHMSAVQVPAANGRKVKEEEPTYNVAGSSTETPPPLHMTLIIGNLLQQCQPESITTNSCP